MQVVADFHLEVAALEMDESSLAAPTSGGDDVDGRVPPRA
jgi:hypothetical protein